MRYLYYNELIEVIPISNSITSEKSIKSSYVISAELVGYEYECVDRNMKIDEVNYLCSKELDIIKQESEGLRVSISDNKSTLCSITPEGYCKVTIKCEHCKSLSNGDSILITTKNPEAFIQVYKWKFESIWGENFNYLHGFSKIIGIFKPDNDIR